LQVAATARIATANVNLSDVGCSGQNVWSVSHSYLDLNGSLGTGSVTAKRSIKKCVFGVIFRLAVVDSTGSGFGLGNTPPFCTPGMCVENMETPVLHSHGQAARDAWDDDHD
jgi:hypothetical protein